MKKLIFTLLFCTTLPGISYAGTIKASVNGMVCAFCATGIEKTFMAQPAVEAVKVDLETKLVTIETKKDQNMDDKEITKLIEDAGYSVTEIARGDENAGEENAPAK